MLRSIIHGHGRLSPPISLSRCLEVRRIGIVVSKTIHQARCKSSLTRQERRRLEREAIKRSKQNQHTKQGVSGVEKDSKRWSYESIRSALQQWIPNPRILGGSVALFDSRHLIHLGTRFSLALVLYFLIENEDVSPYNFDMYQGPSMLPTLPTLGGVYVRETGAWSRLLGVPIKYRKNDVVVFRDEDGRYAGKRIIGVEGDEVLRYGEFVHQYLDRFDWGIAKSVRSPNTSFEDDCRLLRDHTRQITVPPGHIWVEGDFPPFSFDSRQYGPIPVDWIRGRVVGRIWPWGGQRLSMVRPPPLSVAEALSGKYNLHVIRIRPNPSKEGDEHSLQAEV